MATLSVLDAKEIDARPLAGAPIVIATDGRDRSDPALIGARVLAGDDRHCRLVSVVRPLPIVSPEAQLPISADAEAARRGERKRIVRDQLHRLWPDSADLDPEVYDGDAATVIARVANESAAALIIAGLGRHRVIDRLFGDETALRLIRLSTSPVLAAAPGFTQPPRRIIVAVDFSETSLRAARLAIELAAPSAVVYLVHVAPRDSTLDDWGGIRVSYQGDVSDAFRKLREQLTIRAGIVAEETLLHGDPATELLAFAASVNAELIATGSQGHGFVTRMLIGSVTTRVLRCATCSVLSVPHGAAVPRPGVADERLSPHAVPRPVWSERLDEFTRANVGRRGVLEVDDPEIGAQAQERDYPFLGATYDPHDQRLGLMFGELGDVGRHLTRSIGGVSGIDVLTNDRGRDLALRIAHGSGQTLLTFTA
jgi:nucleotide-binding universal stress UspA family protein